MMKRKYLLILIMGLLIIGLFVTQKHLNKKAETNALVQYSQKNTGGIAVYIDGVEGTTFPANNGYYDVDKIICQNGEKAFFNYNSWTFSVSNITETTKCNIYFIYDESDLIINFPSNYASAYESDYAGAVWNPASGKIELSTVNKIKQFVTLTANLPSGTVNLASYIMSLSNAQGVYREPTTDYRYQGKNPNNYLMFNGELWRIIGVFSDNTHGKSGQMLVKIIRNDSIGGIAWNSGSMQTTAWSTASLKTLLNEYYYYGIDDPGSDYCFSHNNAIPSIIIDCKLTKNGLTSPYYRNMVESITWKHGDIETDTINAATIYSAERGTIKNAWNSGESTAYVGLMYPSDYAYSVLANSCSRSTLITNYNTSACGGSSWLYGKGHENLLSARYQYANLTFCISASGSITSGSATNFDIVRPVVYLKSQTPKISGNGTLTNPYIIG